MMHFIRLPHPSPTPDAARDALIADPGFGTVFTDHMVVIDYDEALGGWQTPTIGPRGPICLDPAASVLHYAQEIFEGMKAYAHPEGGLALFRPEANARRFNASARRMAMPEIPEELFIAAVREAVLADANWLPPIDGGALYIRPFMFASEAFLGVRPAKQYKFVVILCAVGNYFKKGVNPVKIWVAQDYTRAAPGGTGAAKTGGNYAASLVPQAEAIAKGSVITPPLTGTILPGITRDSLIAMLREEGLTVREEPYSIDQWREEVASGMLLECLACGTAAVVTPVGTVASPEGEFHIGAGGIGQMTAKMRERLVGVQNGRIADTHGWMMRV
jgi:branched-chain amino acid aminotransferase